MTSWIVSEEIVPRLVIRRAVAEDLPRIVELLQQESLDGEQREDLGPPLPQAYADAFAAIEAATDNDVMVAELDGRIAGTFQLTIIAGLMHVGASVAQVEAVVVDAPLRRHRVGETMMRWAIAEARRRGCSRVQLTSNKRRTDAHRFYERLGFVAGYEGFKLAL